MMIFYFVESETRSIESLTPDYDKAIGWLNKAKFLMPREHWKLRFTVQ